MKTKNLRKQTVAFLFITVALLTHFVKADKLQIQEKLGETVRINLKNVTIFEALNKIGDQAKVKILVSDQAAWKLPYGEATRLSVELDGPLADSLTEMLNAFFMRYAVGTDEITIYPRPELDHIIGRPSTNQLQLLKDIYSKPIRVYITNRTQASINTALGREVLISPLEVQAQLQASLAKLAAGKIERIVSQQGPNKIYRYDVKMPLDENEKELDEYVLPTPVTLAQLLKDVNSDKSRSYGSEWYIPSIDFLGQTPEIRIVETGGLNKLSREQLIDIHYEDMHVLEILRDLAQRGSFYLEISQKAEFGQEKMSVTIQNITIPHAMQRIQIHRESNSSD